MATVTEDTVTETSMLTGNPCEQIGEVAGLVWRALDQGGRMSLTRLAKEVEAPRDMVLQAIGWLAREEKIQIEEGTRGRTISLR